MNNGIGIGRWREQAQVHIGKAWGREVEEKLDLAPAVCDSHAWTAIYTYLSGLGIECYRSGPRRLRPR